MKTAMSSFDIAAIVPDLKALLTGRRVDNVYQLETNLFLFKLTPDNISLIIEPQRRIHTTRYELRTPQKPTQLAMEFRKHLSGKKIHDIRQVEFERTVELALGDDTDGRRLIIEIFPRGALILTDTAGKILASSVYARMRDRAILRGRPYVPAPSIGTNPLRAEAPDPTLIKDVLDLPIVKALTRLYPIGGQYSEEVLLRAQIEKNRAVRSLTQNEWSTIVRSLKDLAESTVESPSPTAYLEELGQVVDVTPIPLAAILAATRQRVDRFDRAIDDYFAKFLHKATVSRRLAKIEARRNELQRTLESQQQHHEELIQQIRTKRAAADAIFSQLSLIRSQVENAWRWRDEGDHADTILARLNGGLSSAPNFRAVSFDTRKSVLTLDVAGFPLTIQRHERPQDIAQTLYDQAKKAEGKIPNLETEVARTQSSLQSVEVEIETERSADTMVHRKREKAWYEKFHWFRSSEGSLIVGGRDASSNEVLVKRHTDPDDIVFHAEIQGAPFVVVKTEGRSPSEKTLSEAAQAAVAYSKAWKIGAGSADVYWVKPAQLSKSPPAGEYLPKGAFAVRGQRNYLRGIENRVAIGITFHDETMNVVGGPPEAIRSNAVVSAILEPGSTPPMKLATKLAKSFNHDLEAKLGRKSNLSAQDLIAFFPPGKSDIVR